MEAFLGLSSHSRLLAHRLGYSLKTFSCKDLSSSIGLFASGLILQGFELRDRVIRVRHSFTRLSLPRVEAFWGLSSHSRLLAHRLASSLKTFFCKALTASKPASESRLTNTGVSPCEVFLFMVLDFATNISQHLQENHSRSPSGRRYLRFFKIFPNL